MLPLAALLGTWSDEEFALASTAHGVAFAAWRALAVEQQPPLYFIVVGAWRTLNASVFFARLPSVVFALCTTLVAARIGARIRPGSSPVPFAAAVAFNPFVVFAAVEIRAYALALLLSALSWLAFYDGFMRDDRPRARLWFVAAAAASIYTQYYLGFALAGFALALIVAARGAALRRYVLAAAAVVALAAPTVVFAARQVGSVPHDERPWPAVAAQWLSYPWTDFLFPAGFGIETFGPRVALQRALATLAVAALLLGRPRWDRRIAALLAIPVAIEGSYLAVALFAHLELTAPRHFVALFIPLWCGAYALIASLRSSRRRLIVRLLAVLYAVATGLTLGSTYRGLAKYGDWPRVAAYLASHTAPGDTILVFGAEKVPALRRYYHGSAPLIPFPRALPGDRYDLAAMTIDSDDEVRHELDVLLHRGRVWLVSDNSCRNTLGCEHLESVVSREERVTVTAVFLGTRVRELSAPERNQRSQPRP